MIKETLKEELAELHQIFHDESGLLISLEIDIALRKIQDWHIKQLEEVRKQDLEEIKKELLEKGHGGGNWRRVINKP